MKIIIASFLIIFFANATHAQPEKNTDSPYESTLVTMRDSVQLATYIFIATDSLPKETIFIRTPENIEVFEREISRFTANGFNVVVQNTQRISRALRADSVKIEQGWDHTLDGYDTIEWIAQQPWSNGKIGTFGRGLSGFTQILLAGSAPQHLNAQYIIATPFNFHDEVVFPGGAFRKALAEKWFLQEKTGDSLSNVEKNHTYGFFWEPLNGLRYMRKANFPIAYVTGWYDAFSKGTIRAFQATQKYAKKLAKYNVRLRIGPWTDNPALRGFGKRRQGELNFPENAGFDILEDAVRWFNRWLKGESTGVLIEPPVQYYLMGAVDEPYTAGNQWLQASAWPPKNKRVRYFLKKNGELGEKPDKKGTAEGYRYNPSNPVSTRGGANLHLESGPMNQQATENRPDVRIFTTQPLVAPVSVAGRVAVKLYAASSVYDTDFTAKITDVYPDGRSMLIADGIIRTRLRESPRFEKLLAPGKVYELQIDLGHTAIVFNSGHRIRLAISSSNSPRFEPNPNSPFGFHKHKQEIIAVNTIYYGGRKASYLLLPVIPLPE